MKPSNAAHVHSTFCQLMIGAILCFCFLGRVAAQSTTTSATDGTTPLGLAPGSGQGSYALSGLDTVNPYNGGLSFHLPLMHIGGRGGAGYTMQLPIEQKWTIDHTVIDSGTQRWESYSPQFNWWTYTAGYSPGILTGRPSGQGAHQETCDGAGTFLYDSSLTRLTFVTPDGTEHELHDEATGGRPANVGSCDWIGSSRGTVFKSADGSAVTFISDSVIRDNIWVGDPFLIYPSGYLMLRDGTRYRIDQGNVTWMRDRNGNKLVFSYEGGPASWITSITDSLNRRITITYATSTTPYDEINFKGFGGASRTMRIWYANLGDALRSGFSLQTCDALFPGINASSSSYCGNQIISEVSLPDGRSYKFRYNSYSELARVELPTGGAIEYDWAAGVNGGAASGMLGVDAVYRRVVERRVYSDGGAFQSRMTYSKPETEGPPTTYQTVGYVDVNQFDASQLQTSERHYYYGQGGANSILYSSPVSYPAWNEGKEYKTEILGTDGATVLRRTESTWQQRPGPYIGPPNDPRVVDTTTTLEPTGANLVSKQIFGYADSVPYNNQSDVYEYDFGTGAPGALRRHTHTDYVTATSYTGAVTGPSLRSLPAQTSVYDASGVERARATFEYDNYAADNNHAALVDRPGISGLDSAFSPSYITRGNATATTHYLLDSSGSVTGSISAYAQYDIAGNVVKAIDARGYATSFDFSDCFGAPDGNARLNTSPVELSSAGQASYAFPTLVTNSLGQTAFTQFDYYLGRPVDAEDANGVVSSGYYNDTLDRPTQIRRAVGTTAASQTSFSYDDVARIVTNTSDQNSYGDNLLKSQEVYDGLGRTTEKRQYETAGSYITVRQTYDALGRSYQTSNPFRSGETIVWTTSVYDALSRLISVTTPDSAVVTTSYSGNTVTVTDQAGKQRRSVTDGLGRLTQVYEDPNGLNYLTSYSYDALDDLTVVNQGSQMRTFVYDSLKRLSSAANPESGTISYQYDNNGNPLSKTDARNITTNYFYDALNRVTSRSYQNDPSGTPPVSYFYDAQSLPSGAPSFSRGYSIGRLVAVIYGSNSSAGEYYGYDAAGRDVLTIQQTGGLNFQVTAAYNLAGAPSGETYPSGHAVTYLYDNAGRTNTFTGNLGDGTNRSYSTGITYTPFGGLAQEQFGTATPIYNKLFYNSRAQLSEIREGITPNDTNWERGAIINNYSLQAGCSGASCNATDDNGTLMKQDVYGPGNAVFSQFYGYDPLNRLQSVREDGPPGPANWQQAYSYDQYGNRKMNSTATWGTGINNMQAAVDPNTTTNRMYAQGETEQNHPSMNYDAAGNQTRDYYSDSASGEGYDRTYDAENRMKASTATDSSGSRISTYTYDGAGRRVKRNINGTETWQVYGLGGELLAEYVPNASPSTPQKEYGYRNGQLLITATAPAGLAANTATDKNTNAVASASPASSTGTAAVAQSFDLLASIKGLTLPQWSGISTVTSASTEAVSDTSTPLFGPSFPYAASLSRSALPLMPQSGSSKIAFASNRDGSAQIYSMNTDGSGLSRLTNDAANDEAPNWSPNNSRIVFQSDRDNLFSGIADIYVMNADGSGQTRLTNDPADDSAPVWSADGTKIAFQSARNGVNYQVYVMNADGSGQVNISNSTANDTQPSWSPDGSKIAFASDRDQAGFSSIYVMNANGTNQTRLTVSGTGLLDQQPVWSPDGTKLTFTSTRDSTVVTWTETDDNGATVTKSKLLVNKEVYVMNANGSAQVRLTNTLENDDSASWSGDGTKIVFRSDRERAWCDPTEQVWVMNPDGTSQVDLSNNGLADHCPSWQHVAANVPPTVSLTSPANGATFIAPANITLTANASDSDGSVTRVDFYQGVTLIGTATASPYTITWNNVAAGSYSLTARATDNLGATTTSAAVTITVNANAPPVVSITSPANGATFNAAANITVTANASDSDGTVSRVDFYQGATLIGTSTTSPYTVTWSNVAAGSYSLTARATDNLGATTISTAVTITVNANAPPAVSITSPTTGAIFTAPANITVTANASDSDGSVSRVDFYQGATLIGTTTTSPYTVNWNNVAGGSYSLTARATDNLGATTTSAPVNLTVNAPPSVSITTPTNGATFTAPANITITANAFDSDGSISRVDFYQGTTLIGTATTSPYTISWNNVVAGGYTITARATDNLGASTTSNPISITVGSPPTVSVTTPTNGTSFTATANVTITANASASNGSISRVEFYQGTTLIGTTSVNPYTIIWNNAAAGGYTLKARAIDNSGASTDSTPVSIVVNAPPTVSVTSPTSGASFTAPANIAITANASDSDGTISRVDFYQGATLIGTTTASPYTINWNNVAAGGYTLTARATDNLGATTSSNPVNLTVNAPPAVNITTPTNGASFTAPANITITANASDSDGSISRVDFYQGTTLIRTATTSPYTLTWNNVAAGSYTLKARAIDNSGASTDSTPVNISVNAPPAVSVTSPTSGANFTAPANIAITANASDSDGTISRVDFYQGTTLIGTTTTSPYNVSWNNVTAGSYSLTAKATDNLGAQTNSTAVNITVITTVADVRWIVTDQLGTPRMIFDQTGSLANVSRHDYLPFGEELYAGVGGRMTAQGYTAIDGIRQHFTGYEADTESGLNYAQARYQSSTQGRFTGVDPISGHASDPQSWNRYTYVGNNPLALTDPTGMAYFYGGAYDPISLVDGADTSAQNNASRMESMLTYSPNMALLNEGMIGAGRNEEESEPQNRGTILVIVGDPGLGEHNQGPNFDRAAETKRRELTADGYTVIVTRASGIDDFNHALLNNGKLDGVEYIGHAGSASLYVGERAGAGTNIDSSNVSQLSNANLNPNAYIKINGCNAGKGGWDLIAGKLANHLDRTVWAFNGPTKFYSSPNAVRGSGGKTVPSTGPLYLMEDRGTRLIAYKP